MLKFSVVPSASLTIALLVTALPRIATAQVGKANQILINRGLQVQGMVTSYDPFHLSTYSNANYTAINWLWDSTPSAMGPAPGFPWARWARTNSPTEMPPLGSESSYLSQFFMLQLGDEWELNDGPTRTNLINWFNAVRSNWPNTILYHNNYGGQVGDTQLGDYIVKAQPDMLSFDSYPFRTDGAYTIHNWFGDLRRWRQFAWYNNIPLATYMQTYYSVSEGTRSPSPSELRLNHFAALAFNAKVLIDFTYNSGASALFTNSFGGDNAPNSLYYEKADAAKRARNFGKALVRLKPVDDAVFNSFTTGIMFIRGKDSAGNPTSVPIGFVADPEDPNSYTDWAFQRNDPYLTNNWTVANLGSKNNGYPGRVIVAWFKLLDESYDGPDYTNEVYMMVVNALTDPTGVASDCLQEIRLNFSDFFLAMEMLNPLTGDVNVQPLTLTNGFRQLVLNLNGGEAALFKFSDGAPFVGSQVVGVPVVTLQPLSRTNSQGTTASFTARAAGSSPLTYQWRLNGTNVPGATTNSFSKVNVQGSDAGNYTLVVSNSLGSVTSSVATLTVYFSPQITTPPANQTVSAGSNVLFTVVATGYPSPTYQWRFNGTNLSGATATSYTRTNAQTADSGNYSVMVSNSIGSTSAVAVLSVNGAPLITAQPQDQATLSGGNGLFSVTAIGAPPLGYQWRRDGSNIVNGTKFSGATSSVLTVSNVQSADLAAYVVVVSNHYGMVTSAPAALSIATTPTIVTQPQSVTNNAGTMATFGVVATGNGLSYRWQRAGTNLFDGENISGSATSILAVGNVTRFDAATYNVVITNAAGSVTSAPATLTVLFALPLHEPFNYPAGTVLSNQMTPDFLTWTDVGTTNVGPIITNVGGNLDVDGLAPSTGNSIRFGSLGKSARLSFISGRPVTNGTLYFSFALKVLDLTGASSSGGFFAGFNNSVGTQPNTPTVVAPRLYLRTTNGGFNLGLAKSTDTSGDWVWHNTVFDTNQTIFIVGAYTFNSVGVTTDDLCKLWINPTNTTFGAASPPASTLTALNGNDIGANQIASFVFFQRSASLEPAAMIADELRIDTNWAGVTPVGTPIITSQPSSRTNNPGTLATFSVAASGTNPGYQWVHDGIALANGGNVSGATSSSLSLSTVTQNHGGFYAVVIYTGGGSVMSVPALLTINSPPTISLQPQSVTTNVGGTANFSVTANGTTPLNYQWRFNGTNIPAATGSGYTIVNVQRTNGGNYSVLVTNVAGSITSSNGLLVVTPVTPVQMNGIALISGGRLQLSGTGDPGQFIIQASSNLENWADVTNILGADGTFQFVDSVTNGPQKFYRAKLYP